MRTKQAAERNGDRWDRLYYNSGQGPPETTPETSNPASHCGRIASRLAGSGTNHRAEYFPRVRGRGVESTGLRIIDTRGWDAEHKETNRFPHPRVSNQTTFRMAPGAAGSPISSISPTATKISHVKTPESQQRRRSPRDDPQTTQHDLTRPDPRRLSSPRSGHPSRAALQHMVPQEP